MPARGEASVGTPAPQSSGQNLVVPSSNERVATLTLDGWGKICDCSDAAEILFEYRRNELLRRQVALLLPQLTGLELVKNDKINPRLGFLCRIGHHFQAIPRHGARFDCRLYLNLLDHTQHADLALIVRRLTKTTRD